MALILAAVWLLLDYPWGLLAFVAIAALYGLRAGDPRGWQAAPFSDRSCPGHNKVTRRGKQAGHRHFTRQEQLGSWVALN
jgi:hypothetical protein